jgi:hypothetical protein
MFNKAAIRHGGMQAFALLLRAFAQKELLSVDKVGSIG